MRRQCSQCKAKLTSRQKRFCCDECRKKWKRECMRKRRGFSDHQHVCMQCGKVIRIGRPALDVPAQSL